MYYPYPTTLSEEIEATSRLTSEEMLALIPELDITSSEEEEE